MQKATFGTRAIAWFGDLLVIAVLVSIISFIFGSAVGLTAGRVGFLSAALLITWFLLLFLLQFLYFGYFWSKDGQSMGMRWLHIRVVRQNKEEQVSFWRAGLHGSVGYWLSGADFYIGYLWALWDDENESWHDKVFDTWVVSSA